MSSTDSTYPIANGNERFGWVSLHRSIQKHWIWENDRWLKWWLTMLMEVNHSPKKFALGYDLMTVNRGQSVKSLRTWAKLFSCSTDTVTKFFNMLENDGMITRETIGKGKRSTTLINIEKYDQYQPPQQTQPRTQTGTEHKHNAHTNNNVNNEIISTTTAVELKKIFNEIFHPEKLKALVDMLGFKGDVDEFTNKFIVKYPTSYGITTTRDKIESRFQEWMSREKTQTIKPNYSHKSMKQQIDENW
jgi:DNA-binding transcriptional regulator YhcF (GntR family)